VPESRSLLTSELAQLAFAPLLQENSKAAEQAFFAVPAQGTPRWLLPAGHREIAPFLESWSPYRLTSRLKWAAVRTAHLAGCLSALPGACQVSISGIEDIDWRYLGWTGDALPVPLVYVGTPGVNRKAVMHLVNPVSAVCDLVVKVPLTEAAKTAILREADVLTILADENYKCAPRLVHVDRENGITSQTYLSGKTAGRRFSEDHWAALRSLMLPDERTTVAGHAMEWQEKWKEVFTREADLATITAALTELDDTEPLPACWVHGDVAPWNMRRLGNGALALLDWEEACRSGLPLQDAFHFLHMQDYLFGARPTAHAAEVERFAGSIGIKAEQCRRLEIAYLAHSYLKRRAVGEDKHCAFLLATLRAVLKKQPQPSWPVISFAGARVSSDVPPAVKPLLSAHIRSDLFAAVIAELNSAGVPYCVLSGHENHAEKGSSDVDFMFVPRDMDHIALLLTQAARRAGARLIQAIRHETNACYFVMVKEDGGEVGYFDPDCSSDYRAHGRLWLSAEKVLAMRRRSRELYVPAVAQEFAYYLIKKVLKQSVADFQLSRLRHLYQRQPANCRAEIGRFWPAATIRSLERALAASDLGWFQTAMPHLLAELKESAVAEQSSSMKSGTSTSRFSPSCLKY